MQLEPVKFSDLPDWSGDDHAAALTAFRRSLAVVVSAKNEFKLLSDEVENVQRGCGAARTFFEKWFTPHRVVTADVEGLLTGYYEPLVDAAREQSPTFPVPLHRRPSDLVNLVGEDERGTAASQLTHARRTPRGIEPYPTRREIEQGALDAYALELFFVRDAVERFVIQVQGSAALRLPDGEITRVTYDGKNGHPYTSIGRTVIDDGHLDAREMTLDHLISWLRSDPQRAQRYIWRNQSYVFFRELTAFESGGPIGVMGCTLSPGRSLAIDPSFHNLGLPIFVTAPRLPFSNNAVGFNRLMIAQDVGSAIRGPVRGDIFVGTGAEAGAVAGTLKHPGQFYVLLPKVSVHR